mgnify:CR=1 FL=1
MLTRKGSRTSMAFSAVRRVGPPGPVSRRLTATRLSPRPQPIRAGRFHVHTPDFPADPPGSAAEVQAKQETEARMLVSDLLEIGMVNNFIDLKRKFLINGGDHSLDGVNHIVAHRDAPTGVLVQVVDQVVVLREQERGEDPLGAHAVAGGAVAVLLLGVLEIVVRQPVEPPGQDEHRDPLGDQVQHRQHRLQALGVPIIAMIPILALFKVFDTTRASAEATNGGLTIDTDAETTLEGLAKLPLQEDIERQQKTLRLKPTASVTPLLSGRAEADGLGGYGYRLAPFVELTGAGAQLLAAVTQARARCRRTGTCR